METGCYSTLTTEKLLFDDSAEASKSDDASKSQVARMDDISLP